MQNVGRRFPLILLLLSMVAGALGQQNFLSMFGPMLGSFMGGGQGGGGGFGGPPQPPPAPNPASIFQQFLPALTSIGNHDGAGANNPFGQFMGFFQKPVKGEKNGEVVSKRLESVVDYDDQVVYSTKRTAGTRSKGVRKWKPFRANKKFGGGGGSGGGLPFMGSALGPVQGPPPSMGFGPMPAPVPSPPPFSSGVKAPSVKNQGSTPSSFDDYEDDIDFSLTGTRSPPNAPPPPPSRFRPVRRVMNAPSAHSIHAVRIASFNGGEKRPLIEQNEESQNVVQNLIGEITALSSVHQQRNNDYNSVERIMNAFALAFTDPKKPKKAILADATEVGRNRALAAHLFESDIVLTVPQMKGIVLMEKEQIDSLTHRRRKRKVITGSVYRWPMDRPIPYRFKDHDPKWRSMIREAIAIWESETCIRFQENYGAVDHIVFYKGSGCFSGIGKTGGSQMISIGFGCDSAGIITHEIGHSLGFWHEQSRPDRDYYVSIRREFIAAGTEANFLRQTLQETDNMGLPYDLGSVMHYGPEAFSTREGEVTIETNDPRFESTIGQRSGPSFVDVKQMNRLYCNEACGGMQLACRHGGYPNPNNCQECKCPPGLTGPICTDVDGGNCGGSDLIASNGWQEINYAGKGRCAWRIKTKNGRIRMRVSGVRYACERTCTSYVEIKAASDFQQTGFRVCCVDHEVNVVSDGEEVLILSEATHLHQESAFRIQYVKVDSSTAEILPTDGATQQPAPAIKWVPGQENRGFRGVDNGPVEQFILNSIPHVRDPARPGASIASMVTEYTLGSLFSAGRRR